MCRDNVLHGNILMKKRIQIIQRKMNLASTNMIKRLSQAVLLIYGVGWLWKSQMGLHYLTCLIVSELHANMGLIQMIFHREFQIKKYSQDFDICSLWSWWYLPQVIGNSGSRSQERILNLKNTSSWETVRPLLKSYLRSCLLLLNQATDGQILDFVLTRLKASTVFFAAFPSLIGRLIKVL